MNHHECIQKALMIALSTNKKQIISIKNSSKNIRSSSFNRSIHFRNGRCRTRFKSAKANVNLSTADFALEHYVAVTTEGESAGVEQLFAEDFNQKIQASNR